MILKWLLVAAAMLAAHPAGALREDGARYDLSIAGLPIGEASLSVAAAGDGYAIDAAADVGFLFWGGAGAARAEGAARAGKAAGAQALSPARYRLSYEGVSRPGSVSIDFAQGRASAWTFAPPIPPEFAEGRVALKPSDLDGVLDPLSALVIAAPADVDPDTLCRRVLPVFSGVTRFDLALEGAQTAALGDAAGGAARVGAGAGAVSCAVRYRPVSGHREGSLGVARLTRPGAVALTLAPLGAGFWGPERVAVQTRFGAFEITRRR